MRKGILQRIAPLLLLLVALAMPLIAWGQETVQGGVLNGKALSLPPPEYPEAAKAASVAGLVVVEVLVAESGKVTTARATSGPKLLQKSAEDAARKAKFAPTLKAGVPVKVEGTLNYNFKP
jgi:periplasmic protein TonB